MLAHSFLSVSEEGLFVWIAVEGEAICCTFQFEKEGLTHTRRCGTRISLNYLIGSHGSLVRLEKGNFF